ncbi:MULTISPECIES: hypothetical protein [unclassified Tatumella]|uniref:hypothetical protein n=1 Tax=unclassified Tatumella TaxID=2649542 RepID=UPI001BB00E5C|nr:MULTISPECIES: hypothetical protein [unclassified Tatumella]MBS0878945.1 hypothetical protein [Tatumella sp. JGM82]MBS0892391.1 hypothetical protein [Tatumella sp. JGM94]MBS0903480.1 hypothetical protein [Tatumella sp. JGM100]
MKKLVFMIIPLTVLSGCAGTDWASINQKVSDSASSLNNTIKGAIGSGTSGGMPVMALPQRGGGNTTDKTFNIPVDVDTAAARLKRHYKFISSGELENLRNANSSGGWTTAAAVDDSHPVWDAQPGSYYKMGSDWNDNDHLEIEVEKNGSGSRLYVVYRSPSDKRLSGTGVQNLMKDIRAVAVGQR